MQQEIFDTLIECNKNSTVTKKSDQNVHVLIYMQDFMHKKQV